MADIPEHDTRPIVLQLRAIDVALACERAYYMSDDRHHVKRLREEVGRLLEAVRDMKDVLEIDV